MNSNSTWWIWVHRALSECRIDFSEHKPPKQRWISSRLQRQGRQWSLRHVVVAPREPPHQLSLELVREWLAFGIASAPNSYKNCGACSPLDWHWCQCLSSSSGTSFVIDLNHRCRLHSPKHDHVVIYKLCKWRHSNTHLNDVIFVEGKMLTCHFGWRQDAGMSFS